MLCNAEYRIQRMETVVHMHGRQEQAWNFLTAQQQVTPHSCHTNTAQRHYTKNQPLTATYQWWPPSHKTSNLISSYTVSLPRVSVLRWPAAAASARHRSCAEMRRQTRATTACGTVRSTGSLDVYTGSARACKTHRQRQQQITTRTSDVRSEGMPTWGQGAGQARPGSDNRWHSLARGILSTNTATYEDDNRLSIENSPHSAVPGSSDTGFVSHS